jgi:hypothetical protein
MTLTTIAKSNHWESEATFLGVILGQSTEHGPQQSRKAIGKMFSILGSGSAR